MATGQPKINGIYQIADGTIGKLMKYDGVSGWFVCLHFPYFRLFVRSQIDEFHFISGDVDEMLLEMYKYLNEDKWTFSSYREEVQYLTDDALEELYDVVWEETQGASTTVANNIIEKIIIDSEWLSEATAQEKIIEYCSSLAEVTPEDIMAKVEAKDRHRWAAIRKSTAFCCLREDVKVRLKKELTRDADDDR